MFFVWIKNAIKRHSLAKLGRKYWRLSQYEKSIECYKEALQLDLLLKGESHKHVAEDYDNIGISYRGLGNYDRAIEYYHKAIAILEGISPEHIFLSIPYNHLGITYRYKGDYRHAVEYHEKALRIQRKWVGPFARQVTRDTEILIAAARSKLEQHSDNYS